jgi:hypothetical protein
MISLLHTKTTLGAIDVQSMADHVKRRFDNLVNTIAMKKECRL